MSFGKMNSRIDIVSQGTTTDAEGFGLKQEQVLISCRAYKEERHGNEAWKNRAVFSQATALFRFRVIPSLKVTTDMYIDCDTQRYNIISVEDIRSRGMYIEVLCEKVTLNG